MGWKLVVSGAPPARQVHVILADSGVGIRDPRHSVRGRGPRLHDAPRPSGCEPVWSGRRAPATCWDAGWQAVSGRLAGRARPPQPSVIRLAPPRVVPSAGRRGGAGPHLAHRLVPRRRGWDRGADPSRYPRAAKLPLGQTRFRHPGRRPFPLRPGRPGRWRPELGPRGRSGSRPAPRFAPAWYTGQNRRDGPGPRERRTRFRALPCHVPWRRRTGFAVRDLGRGSGAMFQRRPPAEQGRGLWGRYGEPDGPSAFPGCPMTLIDIRPPTTTRVRARPPGDRPCARGYRRFPGAPNALGNPRPRIPELGCGPCGKAAGPTVPAPPDGRTARPKGARALLAGGRPAMYRRPAQDRPRVFGGARPRA